MPSLFQRIAKALRSERYTAVDGSLYLQNFPRQPKKLLDSSDIVRWWTFPTMGFDVVLVELSDGTEMRLFDQFDDCIEALTTLAAERRDKVREDAEFYGTYGKGND